MTARQSETHRRVVLRQDNGELAEDVVARELVDQSEPVLDPGVLAERITHSWPLEEVPGRPHPAAAVPGTLPRTA